MKFTITETGDLRISIDIEEQTELREAIAESIESEHYLFIDLLEKVLCNSEWEFIAPEEIGALTDSFILSDTATRDDHGKLQSIESVYWYPDYQVKSEGGELAEYGEIVFRKGSDWDLQGIHTNMYPLPPLPFEGNISDHATKEGWIQ